MKLTKLFIPVLCLIGLTANSQIETKTFSKNKSASISRISLFKNGESGKIAPNILWSQFDATKRSSVIAIIPDGNGSVKLRVLAENTPDAAIETISKITNSIDYKEISAESAVEFSKSIAQIKRSSAVENFRSISYRISELVSNDGTLDTEVKALIEKLIDGAIATSEGDNNISIEENKSLQIKYEANLQEQKNKTTVLDVLKAKLEKETDETKKEEIIDKMTELVK